MRSMPSIPVRGLGLAMLAALGVSCASGGLSPQALVVFPPPPDTARFQYLTKITSLDDVAGGGGRSWFSWLVGAKKTPSAIQLMRPFGLAVGKGKIYVCDVNLPGVQRIDLDARTMRQIVSPQLTQPTNCGLDPVSGDLYVADVQRQEVVILGADGMFAGVITDSLRGPGDVTVTEDRIWITDLGTRQVRVYDKASRRHLFAFPDTGLRGNAPGTLIRPMNLAVGHDEVFVSDQIGRRVQVYSTDGRYLRTIGGPGVGFGQFDVPKGVAVDQQGLVYVADFRWGHVQVFDREGRVLTFLAGGGYRGPGYLGGPMDVVVDYENLNYFRKYVSPEFTLKYLVLVTNQLSPDKLTVYGFVEPRQTGGKE